jgi:gamma-glutamylcyclotransferase (GGCT)/AIG2-like uncharacterized protein YtfP
VDAYPLFVYGTLLRGQPNHHLLTGRAGRILCGWMVGVELYSMGVFPMMVEGQGSVLGEIVYLCSDVRAYAATLGLLDRLEGVDGSLGLYRRELREVYVVKGEPTLAWVYLGQRRSVQDRPRVRGDDWSAHLANR